MGTKTRLDKFSSRQIEVTRFELRLRDNAIGNPCQSRRTRGPSRPAIRTSDFWRAIRGTGPSSRASTTEGKDIDPHISQVTQICLLLICVICEICGSICLSPCPPVLWPALLGRREKEILTAGGAGYTDGDQLFLSALSAPIRGQSPPVDHAFVAGGSDSTELVDSAAGAIVSPAFSWSSAYGRSFGS